ncbi:hypothetical protein [Streptomyces triticisoli]|uniref:hypothetical protein n=1 Tax=Streptomyces triticisoli TaxID=2182797 RepID=UPI0022B7D847|nr:hypothetical protein [Streptomyces triticisoli]
MTTQVLRTPGARAAERARAPGVREAYEDKGWGAGTAAFIVMTSWPREVLDDTRPAGPY